MKRAVAALLLVAACGPVDLTTYVPPDGKACYDDSDCVPNDCCGNGDTVVHKDDAPDCTTVSCGGTACPIHGIKCGCAVPVCRQSRCIAATSPTPECGG